MASRLFSTCLSQLQNGDRTWCKKLNPWCSSNVTPQSPTRNVCEDLSKSFALKISVHSVHSDRREMCSKKSGCTFPPKGAGEASSTRPGFSQANCHGFHALILTLFCRWRDKCSSGGVSLSIWIAGQPERAHYSSLFKLCTDLTCSCYYLTAWMQKPDRYWAFCLDSKYSKTEASNRICSP